MIKSLMRFTLVFSLMFGLTGSYGCGQSATQPSTQSGPQPQSLPTISMTLGNKAFTLETATEDKTREIGLMYRDSMPADHGMIFAFVDERPQSFWMKNTRIPLDIVYINSAGKIVSIQGMRAFDLTGIDSGQPAKYAIELNLDAASAAGLHIGDNLQVPKQVTDAAR